MKKKNPAWSINIDGGDATVSINNHVGDTILSLSSKQAKSYVGIRTNKPEYELDVAGFVGMQGRIGTMHKGKVPADGKWHPIVKNLNGCHSFEIAAGVGKKKTGKYALVHAQALSTYGKSKNKVRVLQAYYGSRYNKIDLRWTGATYDYQLEMRTKRPYGGDFYINYYISALWLDQFMEESSPDS